jgi:hypothetical protein
MPAVAPAAVANRLRQLEDALDAGAKEMRAAVEEYKRLGAEASRAEMRAELEYAKVFLATDGAEYLRKQTAVEATAQVRHEARIAAHLVATQKEALWSLREAQKRIHAQIDVARTLAADMRAELELDKTNWRP